MQQPLISGLLKKRKPKPFFGLKPPVDPSSPGEEQIQSKKSPLSVAIVAVVAAIGLTLIILGKKWIGKQETKTKEINNQEKLALEEYEREVKKYEEEQEKYFGELQNRRQSMENALHQIQGKIMQNNNEFRSMVSTTKESYDSFQSGLEDEQSISTAFMLKDDIDKKKQHLIDETKQLTQHQQHLIRELMQINNQLGIPSTQPNPQGQPQPPQQKRVRFADEQPIDEIARIAQQHQAQQASAAMNNFYGDGSFTDGTGRQMLPT